MMSAEADELEKTTQTLNAKKSDLNRAQKALEDARKRESSLSSGVSGLQASLDVAMAEAGVRQAEADAALADFEREEVLLRKRQTDYVAGMRTLYKQMMAHKTVQVVTLLDAGSLVEYARISDYQSKILEDERSRVLGLAQDVADLEARKVALKETADKAQAAKADLEKKMASLKAQIANARYAQSASNNQIVNLNKDIQGLTAEQQRILDAKLAANNAGGSLGDKVPVTTTPVNPDFGDPAYAFSSYGVPHRVGLSQYGAAGRAYVGQNYAQIIPAYYHNVSIQTIEMPATIEVQGVGAVPFEDRYLKLVREMPRSWPMEALKTQAILARTYAYKWIRDNRGAICTTQTCQVYKHSDNPDSTDVYDVRWFQAVAATRGVVVTQNDYPIGAYYASTNGGISQQSGQVWNTNLPYLKIAEDCDGGWPNNCYETRGGTGLRSPWFHKAWGDRYGRAETSTGTNCPTCNPWLKKSEVVDLANAALLYQKTNSTSGTVNGVSYNLAVNGSSPQQVIDALQAAGETPLGDFAAIQVYQNKPIGQSDRVQFVGGPRVSTTITATAMRASINLRAPGTIFLNSKLFDVVRP